MRFLRNFSVGLALCSITFLHQGCFGSFSAVGNVYEFNQNIGTNDPGGGLLRSLVFLGLVIIPVYEIAAILDWLIFNLIEYWGGANPVAMNSVQQEKQIVQKGGERFEITATQNMFHIVQLTGTQKGAEVDVIYIPSQNSWYRIQNNVARLLPADTFKHLTEKAS